MPTPEWRMDFAREFVRAQKDIKACVNHAQIKHQLNAAGIRLEEINGEVWLDQDGQSAILRNVQDLVQYLS